MAHWSGPAGATGLTAALVATAGQAIANQTIDATGCDVGIYVVPTASGVTITGTTVSNANTHGIYAQDTTGLTVSGSTVRHNGLRPRDRRLQRRRWHRPHHDHREPDRGPAR